VIDRLGRRELLGSHIAKRAGHTVVVRVP
jgi:hypothetical protein